jgi:hypothetical protein
MEGNSKAVHLHIEVHKGSYSYPSNIDPLKHLKQKLEEMKEMAKLDNAPDEYAKTAVNKAIDYGILKGNDKGDLMLHSPVTWQDLLVILERCGVV